LDWFEVWSDWPPSDDGDGAWFLIAGEYATEAEAHVAATARLQEYTAASRQPLPPAHTPQHPSDRVGQHDHAQGHSDASADQ
jgi:hypothetical protein